MTLRAAIEPKSNSLSSPVFHLHQFNAQMTLRAWIVIKDNYVLQVVVGEYQRLVVAEVVR